MVTIEEIQSAYYMVAATGVLIAAIYYIMNLRNADREKRRQNILMRMPPMDKTYYDYYCYLNLTILEEIPEQERRSPEYNSKTLYIISYFNMLGVLYAEGLMSIEDILKVYAPASIINMFERTWRYILNTRLNSYGKDADPNYAVPFERLYREMKRRYPNYEGSPSSVQEREERYKRRQENVWSKITKDQFLASVMK